MPSGVSLNLNLWSMYRPLTEITKDVANVATDYFSQAEPSFVAMGCSLMELGCGKPYDGTNVGIDGNSIWMKTNVVEGYAEQVCVICHSKEESSDEEIIKQQDSLTITQNPRCEEAMNAITAPHTITYPCPVGAKCEVVGNQTYQVTEGSS